MEFQELYLQLRDAHAIWVGMTLKNLANIFILALWISIQTIMVFSHPAMAGEMSHSHVSSVSASSHHTEASHNKMHAHAGDMKQDIKNTDTHHNQANLDECCDSGCSVVGAILAGSLCNPRLALIIEQRPDQLSKAVFPGLPTPPPNTII